MFSQPQETLDSVLYHWEKLLERWWLANPDGDSDARAFERVLGAGKEMITRAHGVGVLDAIREHAQQ